MEEVRGSLDSTDNGAVKNSIRNCLTVFQNDPKLEGAIRYNILTVRIDIVNPNTQSESGRLVQHENGQHHLYHRRSFQRREQGHLGGQDETADA